LQDPAFAITVTLPKVPLMHEAVRRVAFDGTGPEGNVSCSAAPVRIAQPETTSGGTVPPSGPLRDTTEPDESTKSPRTVTELDKVRLKPPRTSEPLSTIGLMRTIEELI